MCEIKCQFSYRRRYDIAEKEFIAAKMNLHLKEQRKELLTEHLLQIIDESETRKSQKLADLMVELEIID